MLLDNGKMEIHLILESCGFDCWMMMRMIRSVCSE